MDNEILYREFWIRCTKDKLIDLSEDLVHDARVDDFGKLCNEEEMLCKTDAKTIIMWIDWVLPIIEPLFPVSDTIAQNRIRMMKAMRSKMQRRIPKN